MTSPGHRLRTVAAGLCGPQAMERLIDPMLADLQAEYGEAVRRGRVWRSRWVRLAGFITFVKVIVLHGCERAICDWTADDHRALHRTIGGSITTILATTLLLLVPPLLNVPSWTHTSRERLAVYLIPQAFPLAVPVGFMLGVLYGLGGCIASRRLAGVVLVIAIICSGASFATMAWGAPASNNAYRARVVGHGYPMKGANELTFGELRQLLKPGAYETMELLPPRNVRYLALNYHTRWALSGATFVFALFALSVLTRRPAGRFILGATACGAAALMLATTSSRSPGPRPDDKALSRHSPRHGSRTPFSSSWPPFC